VPAALPPAAKDVDSSLVAGEPLGQLAVELEEEDEEVLADLAAGQRRRRGLLGLDPILL